MKVVEVNVGKKIEYSVSKNKITFADELMLNCEKLDQEKMHMTGTKCLNRSYTKSRL